MNIQVQLHKSVERSPRFCSPLDLIVRNVLCVLSCYTIVLFSPLVVVTFAGHLCSSSSIVALAYHRRGRVWRPNLESNQQRESLTVTAALQDIQLNHDEDP